MSALKGFEEERRELERVLHSEGFVRAPGLASFLSYVSGKYFQGEAGQIKEYNIAIEAFGRPPDFNQKQDSVVRVEAHRLRKRLREYYESEGVDHPIHIVIPAGQYVPQFIHRSETAVDGAAPLPVPSGPASAEESLPVPAELLQAPLSPPVSAKMPRARPTGSWTRFSVAAMVTLGLILGAFALTRRRPETAAAIVPLPSAIPASEETRVLAGNLSGSYVDRLGNTWLSDRFFKGGSSLTTPGHRIWRTTDASIFQTRREGTDFAYDIPLPPGRYELHLYFAETVFGEENVAGGGETSRIFQVSANGQLLLAGLDVTSDAGGASIADEKVFTGIVPALDGSLHLAFHTIKESAILNGIALLPAPSGKPRPIRILARDYRYTDQKGQVWLPDRYFIHGQTVMRPEAIDGTTDPEIYRGERFGNFTYTIPVAEGRYTVRLRFNEAWFGPGRPGGGGPGSRIFDVYANGQALLRNFDIFQAAGGPNRAIEKVFHGLTPNAQGKIAFSFLPVRNYACINAIEIVDESG